MKNRKTSPANIRVLAILIFLFIGNQAKSNSLQNGFSKTQQPYTYFNKLNKTPKMSTIKIDLDSLKKSNWSKQEFENAELMVDFIQHLMNDHDFNYISNHFGDNQYIQHSRGIADGMNELIKYVKDFSQKFPEYTYDVKHIYLDGDYVIFHSHATVKKKHRGNDKKGFNIIDTWKIRDGKIEEHWDAIQPLNGFMRFYIWLTGGKVNNSNGLF